MSQTDKLTISIAPHVHSGAKTQNIMLYVIIALLPSMAVSVYNFGIQAVMQYSVSILSCVIFEYVFNKIIKRDDSVKDLSAVVTGILLAMNIPAAAPLWVVFVGAFVAIIIAKMVFGGLGSNPFNPALVGRIFLLISFPVQMTMWTEPDGQSGATVLGASKAFLGASENGLLTGFKLPEFTDTLLGFTGGSLGETSTVAILVGGVFLIATRVITWHIPVAFVATVFVMISGHLLMHPESTIPAIMHITSGGLMLGAFFMATDYATSPLFGKGKIIFGIGCGLLTVVIRLYGNYPEGVAFSILIMNSVVPLLDRYLRPKSYGEA